MMAESHHFVDCNGGSLLCESCFPPAYLLIALFVALAALAGQAGQVGQAGWQCWSVAGRDDSWILAGQAGY